MTSLEGELQNKNICIWDGGGEWVGAGKNVQPKRGYAKLKATLITNTNEETSQDSLKKVFHREGKHRRAEESKQTSCACQEINDLSSQQPVGFCSFSTS